MINNYCKISKIYTYDFKHEIIVIIYHKELKFKGNVIDYKILEVNIFEISFNLIANI
jgi:hypothetical protein